MTSKFPKPPSDDNLQSLAHDLLGVDLNSPVDFGEPLDVDGLGLDDLGFGLPQEKVSAAPASASDVSAPAAESSEMAEDPLAWIVRAVNSPIRHVPPPALIDDEPEIDDWDDDDFGSGLLDVPAGKSTKSVAFVEETDEFDDDVIDEVEDDISFVSDESGVSDEFDDEDDEVSVDAVKSGSLEPEDSYWDALDNWDGWEDKPAASKAEPESSARSERGRGRGRGRGDRGDRRRSRDREETRSEVRERHVPKSAPEEEVEQPETVAETRQSREERPARSRSRRRRGARQESGGREAAPEVTSHQETPEPALEPRREGRRSGRGAQPVASQEKTRDIEPENKGPEGEASERKPRDKRRRRGRGDRREEAPRPVEPVLEVSNEDLDDFGGGIFGEIAPVQPSRSKAQPVVEVYEEEEVFEDDVVETVVDDADGFGAGLLEEQPRRRRGPPQARKRAEPQSPAQTQPQPQAKVAPESSRSEQSRSSSGQAKRGRRVQKERQSAEEVPVSDRVREIDEIVAVDPDRYAGIPTWEHAISLLVKKQPKPSGSRRSSGGNGGRGGDERRRRGNGNGRGNRSGSSS